MGRDVFASPALPRCQRDNGVFGDIQEDLVEETPVLSYGHLHH